MFVKNKAFRRYRCFFFTTTIFATLPIFSPISSYALTPLTPNEMLAKQLGWVDAPTNTCGGYYLEDSFLNPVNAEGNQAVAITGDQGLVSRQGTSTLEGKVSVTRFGQQITGNKAYVYRDKDYKLSAIDIIGNVNLREPNSLIIGKTAHYNFKTGAKSLIDILYRTSVQNNRDVAGPHVNQSELAHPRKIIELTAWGKADQFEQNKPDVYEFSQASFSTCPPANPTWRLKASHIVLDKESGRGYATHTRLYFKEIPVFYIPYFNFPIDSRRKTGFLFPTIGLISNKWGSYIITPFYWNIAPNEDLTFSPGLLTKRGVQLTNDFRYLTETSEGNINLSILPSDREFSDFQMTQKNTYLSSTNPVTQAELNHLLHTSDTRKAFIWRNHSQFNDYWSGQVDFNYAGDDYYLQDFGSNLNEITQNQLLQEALLNYRNEHWDITGRVQAYQTLHPIIESLPAVQNQYRRFPQFIVNADYPDQAYGLQYFITNDLTHFEILKTPGSDTNLPVGERLHTQPGIGLPIYYPYFYFNPHIQVALTDYSLHQTKDIGAPSHINRAIPIFDLASGIALTQDAELFGTTYQHTLEPQIYYAYIPYHDQSQIPVFDTTLNTLTYNQLFNYNRFSGIDRIGDANQLGIGVTTRLIDQESGLEKVRLGIGDIIYFADRKVTLCNSANECTDYPGNPTNHYRLSPISGLLSYNVSNAWNLSENAIWNPISKQLDSSTFNIAYHPKPQHVIGLGYTYVRNGDYFTGITTNTSENNLKLTNLSIVWPLFHDVNAVGRWSQDWHSNHFQDLIYGVEYDTCCWTVRMVGGRTFTTLSPNNSPQYRSEFYIQFALKGFTVLGGDPKSLLNSISGYQTQFGQGI